MLNSKVNMAKATDVLEPVNEHTIHQEKSLVVADLENILISIKKDLKLKPDLISLDEYLHDNYQVLEKIGFSNIQRMNGNRITLQRLGWEIKDIVTKDHDETSDSEILVKNALDLEMALFTYDYFIESGIRHIVIITGDGDFIPLVRRLRKRGVIVEAISVSCCMSKKLRRAVDKYTSYEEIVGLCQINDNVKDQDLIIGYFEKVRDFLYELSTSRPPPYNASAFKVYFISEYPEFNEKKMGFAMFKDFLIAAEKHRYLTLRRDEKGIWIYPSEPVDVIEHQKSLMGVDY